MRSETILKRPDGNRVQIDVTMHMDGYDNKVYWNVEVYECPKGKRSFMNTYSSDDWDYRKLSPEERKIYKLNKQLNWVTQEEINQAKLKLIDLIKATI